MAVKARGGGGSVQVTAPPRPTPQPVGPIEVGNAGLQGVAPAMIASLPLMASGNDVYMRQFYRNMRVPYRRYMPIRNL